MKKTIMEMCQDIEDMARQLEKDTKELRIEPNKMWLDGKVITLWEIQH